MARIPPLRSFWTALLCVILVSSFEASAQAQSVIEGVWLSKSKSEITIKPCREGFCGYISHVVVPEDALKANRGANKGLAVEDFKDANNKDPKLRSRPVLGLRILTLKAGRKSSVFDGEVYNPEDGNTYSGYLQVLDAGAVRLNGCVLFNVICRGEDWARLK